MESSMNSAIQIQASPVMEGHWAKALLSAIAHWGPTVTIVQYGGSVFEFKGAFPEGSIGYGFYNFGFENKGFNGHIRLETISHISFQDKKHRGKDAYAFKFQDEDDKNLFKVFLGRNDDGKVFAHQLEAFKRIRETLSI